MLTAAGDVRGGGTGKECLENLLNTSTEPWNKWVHPGAVTSSWVQADFTGGRSYCISGYSLCSANDAPGRDPVAWTLQGRTGELWTTLHEADFSSDSAGAGTGGFSTSSRWQWLSFDLSAASEPLTAVRLQINAVRTPGDCIQLGHLQLRCMQGSSTSPCMSLLLLLLLCLMSRLEVLTCISVSTLSPMCCSS